MNPMDYVRQYSTAFITQSFFQYKKEADVAPPKTKTTTCREENVATNQTLPPTSFNEIL